MRVHRVLPLSSPLGANAFDALPSFAGTFILDFTGVEQIDSRGLVALVRLAEASKSQVVLAGLSAGLINLMQATHLHAQFDIYATVDVAITSMSEGDPECFQSGAIPIP
jgi:anti-anti-sigma regulatory factor